MSGTIHLPERAQIVAGEKPNEGTTIPLNGKLRPISGGRAQAVSAQLGKGRTAFNPPPLSVRGVQALKKGVKKCLWDGMKWIPIPVGSVLLSTEKPVALV